MNNPNTKKFWDDQFKDEWKKWTYLAPRWLPFKFEWVARLLKPGKVLDIGCGLGHFNRYLHAFAPGKFETYGVDISDFAIKKAIKLDPTSHYAVAGAYKLPFEDNFFDIVTSLDVIEHLANVPKFLKEVARVVKPGGYVVITTPHIDGEFPRSVDHLREYTHETLTKEMSLICGDYHFAEPLNIYDMVKKVVIYDSTLFYRGVVR